jgi:hypothetical protein
MAGVMGKRFVQKNVDMSGKTIVEIANLGLNDPGG